MKYIGIFSILEFSSFLSDVHCPVVFSLNYEYVEKSKSEQKCNITEEKIKNWENERAQVFKDNIDISEVDEILSLLSSDTNSADAHINVDEIVNKTSEIIINAAKVTFGTYNKSVKKDNESQKKKENPWFNNECKVARKKFRKNKRKYFANKCVNNLDDYKKAEKEYKKIIDKNLRKIKKK